MSDSSKTTELFKDWMGTQGAFDPIKAYIKELETSLEDTRNAAVENIRELNDRLIERQESFQTQLIRIEDTWREKLKEKDEEIRLLKFKVSFL